MMRSFLLKTLYLLIISRAVLLFWIPSATSFSAQRPQSNRPSILSSAIRETQTDSTRFSSAQSTEVDSDERIREFAFRVSKSFEPQEFRPATPILANKHVQTISGALLRNDNSCRYVTADPAQEPNNFGIGLQLLVAAATKAPGESNPKNIFWDKRERIDTPDGDFFHVDSKFVHGNENNPSTKGLVIIVHGLQSNSNSTLVVDMATAYGHRGFDVACINFRGCSGEPNEGLKAYHLGFTDDLKHYLSLLKNRRDSSKPISIYITGKSLGANVVLNALGELGMSALTEFNIQGAAVNCVPFDNERNKDFLLQGLSKIIYNGKLLQSLKETAFRQLERFGDTLDAQKVDSDRLAKATTITEFDETYIAPLFGFQNYRDYYNQTSCLNFLDKIRVPTLILNSRDDPFMDPAFFPWEYGCDSESGEQNQSPIRMLRSEHGGHLGYMFHSQVLGGGDGNGNTQASFMPTELARFINHCHEQYVYLTNDGEVL